MRAMIILSTLKSALFVRKLVYRRSEPTQAIHGRLNKTHEYLQETLTFPNESSVTLGPCLRQALLYLFKRAY